jgi:hypothetical protein
MEPNPVKNYFENIKLTLAQNISIDLEKMENEKKRITH